jgi:hypothetical protein
MAEGPDHVYICYYCARKCEELIKQEWQRRGISLPEEPDR